MSYIKLDRKMLSWEWRDDPSVVCLWVYILLKANYRKSVTSDGMEIGEGCLLTSEGKLAKETGLSRQQVRTAIAKLISTKEITKSSTKSYTLIKVNKWAKYQGLEDRSNQEDNQDFTQFATKNATKTATIYKEIYKKNQEDQEEEIYKEDFSEGFREALEAFTEMRKKIKKPLTDRAKQMLLKKLADLSTDEQTQIEILNQSTMNCWQGVFPLQQNKQKNEEVWF